MERQRLTWRDLRVGAREGRVQVSHEQVKKTSYVTHTNVLYVRIYGTTLPRPPSAEQSTDSNISEYPAVLTAFQFFRCRVLPMADNNRPTALCEAKGWCGWQCGNVGAQSLGAWVEMCSLHGRRIRSQATSSTYYGDNRELMSAEKSFKKSR